MTKSFYFLKEDPDAGQGLEANEEKKGDKQSGQGHRKPDNLPKKQQLWPKAFFEVGIRLQDRDLQ
jgi:hypothetical protein